MLDGGDLQEQELERRDEGHDRWLKMQSAYAEYTRASEALECTHQSADDSSTTERLQLIMLEGKQRVAFERYLETRMEFLECRFDESNRPCAALTIDAEDSWFGSRLAFVKPRPLLEILAVILLCTIAFSLVREKQHLRNLEASRDELQATLKETRTQLQSLGQRVDAGKPPQHSVIHQVGHSSHAASGGPSATTGPQAPPEEQRKHKAALHVQQKQTVARKREAVAPTQNPGVGTRGYRSFSLAASHQFTRVGPIEVSLRSVDARRNRASLVIVSNLERFDLQRVETNQPVWINIGGNQPLLELVVDRIAENRLDGHLVETRNGGTEPRDSRLKSGLPASPS
jgi:hypothetical protein